MWNFFIAFDQGRKIAFDPRVKSHQIILAAWGAGLRRILMLDIGAVRRMLQWISTDCQMGGKEEWWPVLGIGSMFYLQNNQLCSSYRALALRKVPLEMAVTQMTCSLASNSQIETNGQFNHTTWIGWTLSFISGALEPQTKFLNF